MDYKHILKALDIKVTDDTMERLEKEREDRLKQLEDEFEIKKKHAYVVVSVLDENRKDILNSIIETKHAQSEARRLDRHTEKLANATTDEEREKLGEFTPLAAPGTYGVYRGYTDKQAVNKALSRICNFMANNLDVFDNPIGKKFFIAVRLNPTRSDLKELRAIGVTKGDIDVSHFECKRLELDEPHENTIKGDNENDAKTVSYRYHNLVYLIASKHSIIDLIDTETINQSHVRDLTKKVREDNHEHNNNEKRLKQSARIKKKSKLQMNERSKKAAPKKRTTNAK